MLKGPEGHWTWSTGGFPTPSNHYILTSLSCTMIDGENLNEAPPAIEGSLRDKVMQKGKKKKKVAPAGNVEKASVGELEEELIVGVLEELSVIKSGPNDMDTRVIDIDAMRKEVRCESPHRP